MAPRLSRREFQRKTAGLAGAAAAFSIVPAHVLGGPRHTAPSDRLAIAGIGVGGMGFSNLRSLESEAIVALCDVDLEYAAETIAHFPDAAVYTAWYDVQHPDTDRLGHVPYGLPELFSKQIANAQVQLANNPALAARALQLADQRVRELSNPAYTPVRRAIADELAALAATEDVDVEGITLALGSLAATVPTLPLVNDIAVPGDDTPAADLDGMSGWARAGAATREALSGMVRVRRSDERVEPMLSPEAEYFLRLNLQLKLQAARLSLLLGDAAGFRQSLDDAATWLGQYFDRDDPAVTTAIATLEQTAATAIVTERPDVSGSLTLLRRQRQLARAGE